jgi:hypothetical protein
MSFPAHSLDVAAVVPGTILRVQERQRVYRDEVQIAGSVSDFVSCDLAHNPLPSERSGLCARGFNFHCSPPPIVTPGLESTGGRSSRRRRFGLRGYPHQVGLGIAGPCPLDLPLAEDLVE